MWRIVSAVLLRQMLHRPNKQILRNTLYEDEYNLTQGLFETLKLAQDAYEEAH
jgi:hypothetical protein